MVGLLRVPDVGVEVPVDHGRVREQRRQLQHVAVDLELDAGHVVEHVAEALAQGLGLPHGVVDRLQRDRRVLGGKPVDVLDEATVDGGRRGHAGENSQPSGP